MTLTLNLTKSEENTYYNAILNEPLRIIQSEIQCILHLCSNVFTTPLFFCIFFVIYLHFHDFNDYIIKSELKHYCNKCKISVMVKVFRTKLRLVL